VSLATKPPAAEHVEKCFRGIGRSPPKKRD